MSQTRPTSFLHQVARRYAALPPQELCDYCFVFPNQRSGRFFLEELQHQFQTDYIMPAVTPLTEFLSELASDLQLTPSLQIASSIETLMALYKAYEEIFGEQAQSFDHFVYWANIIVNDFNEVDLALVDPRKLYTNLSDLHDIRSNYIDKELHEDIKRIFGKAFSAINEDNGDTLWANHSSQEETDGEIKQRFLSLWQQLDTLYTRYHEQLGQQGLTTLGHLMREVADRITQQGVSSLRHRRYVMVGFAMLSASQMKIFKAMKQVTDFWWDDASPLLKQDVDCNHAANLIKGLHAEFPEMQVNDIDPDFAARGQDIKMVAAPGNIAQAKQAFREIGKLIDSRAINPDNAINTAIVMPDETLFVPLINSVDRRITKINATLGYPLRNSSIVSLMHLVAIMHHKAGHDKQQETTFYREDVNNVLSHPIIKTVFVHDASVVNQEIDRQGLFNVPQSLFKGTGFESLFVSAPQANEKEQATAYINQLREFATTVYKHINAAHNTEPSTNEHDRPVMTLQSAFIIQYFLCFRLGWFPLQLESLGSAGSLFSWKMFSSMIPAILSLGFGTVAGLTRYTRAELSEVLTGDYMLLARTKGLTKAQAIRRHAMRNAMVVILPMIIGEFIGILGGSLIIENIFGIPGVGNLYINSINVRDYNFFMALTVFYTFIGLASGILTDISYGFIDPRIRMGSKK